MINPQNKRYKDIGSRIKALREQDKLSQQDLADAVGFESATAISLIEKGLRKVSIPDLEKTAKALHTTMVYLLGEEETIKNLNPKLDFKFALRADSDLSSQDKESILQFYSFIKKKRGQDGK